MKPVRGRNGPDPGPGALLQQAVDHHQAGRHAQAELLYQHVLAGHPAHAGALHCLAVLLWQTGRSELAAERLAESLRLAPREARAHSDLGNILRSLGRRDEALACHDRAIELDGRSPEFHVNRGVVLRELGRRDEAEAACRQALRLRPDLAVAHNNLGNLLVDGQRAADALAAFDRALAIAPRYADAWSNRGHALHRLDRLEDGLASCERALALQPGLARAHQFRGELLLGLERFGEAARALETADRALPDEPLLLERLIVAKQAACDWAGLPALIERAERGVREQQRVSPPFALLLTSDDPALQQQAARRHAASLFGGPLAPLWRGEVYTHPRIRVAYLSADFRDHATSYLAARVFELHDPARCEVLLVSFWHAGGDAMRQRLERAPLQILDADTMSDEAVAAWLLDRRVDIAVDLMGLAGRARPGILRHRPAPLQLAWLGYPGTLGCPFIDYLVADAVVVPPGAEAFFDEQLLRLPHSYQPNDDRRDIASPTPTRAELGLPAQGFVFCCFNKPTKILPAVFERWVRILHQVPGSVLWLLGQGEESAHNLRREAERRGLAGERLVFAPRLPQAEHLARHRLADLALDTWPCNAHTTASDALWAGLPLLTRPGRSFAARVGASLLQAVGLPELIAESDEAYEALAVALAQNRPRLADLRARLAAQRLHAPLFDSAGFTRRLEQVYEHITRRQRAGQAPAGFTLSPLSPAQPAELAPSAHS